MIDLKQLEAQLTGLLHGEHSSLTLSFNDESGPNYTTIGDLVEQAADMFDCGWVSDEERAKAIETNRCWTLQWYPKTPVGFSVVRASTLEAAVHGALDDAKDEAA